MARTTGMQTERAVMVRNKETGEEERWMFELTVDADALYKKLGRRAFGNRNKSAVLGGGAIKVTCRPAPSTLRAKP